MAERPMGGGEERPVGYGRYEKDYVARYETDYSYRDKVHWGPILAGVFVALSASAVLGLLGLAVGAAVWDPTAAQEEGFGWGATIWGTIVLILSFGAGGWIAARSSAAPGEQIGVLNGAMVWAVGVPVMFWVLTGTFGAIMGPAAMMAQGMSDAQADQIYATPRAQPEAQQQQEPAMEPEQAQEAFNIAAWGTLIALLLGLGAAAGGGYLGGAGRGREHREHEHHERGPGSPGPPPPTTEP